MISKFRGASSVHFDDKGELVTLDGQGECNVRWTANHLCVVGTLTTLLVSSVPVRAIAVGTEVEAQRWAAAEPGEGCRIRVSFPFIDAPGAEAKCEQERARSPHVVAVSECHYRTSTLTPVRIRIHASSK